MIDDKKKDDVFLNSIEGARPLNKKNTNYKKPTSLKMPKPKEADKTPGTKIPLKESNQKAPPRPKKHLRIEKININKKIKKGTFRVEKTIDLHGYSISDAKNYLFEKIGSFYLKNIRCLVVITGKGQRPKDKNDSKNKLFYGKIRNEFPYWLQDENISNKILSYQQADPNLGGEGAFVVYLRKKKS